MVHLNDLNRIVISRHLDIESICQSLIRLRPAFLTICVTETGHIERIKRILQSVQTQTCVTIEADLVILQTIIKCLDFPLRLRLCATYSSLEYISLFCLFSTHIILFLDTTSTLYVKALAAKHLPNNCTIEFSADVPEEHMFAIKKNVQDRLQLIYGVSPTIPAAQLRRINAEPYPRRPIRRINYLQLAALGFVTLFRLFSVLQILTGLAISPRFLGPVGRQKGNYTSPVLALNFTNTIISFSDDEAQQNASWPPVYNRLDR